MGFTNYFPMLSDSLIYNKFLNEFFKKGCENDLPFTRVMFPTENFGLFCLLVGFDFASGGI